MTVKGQKHLHSWKFIIKLVFPAFMKTKHLNLFPLSFLLLCLNEG